MRYLLDSPSHGEPAGYGRSRYAACTVGDLKSALSLILAAVLFTGCAGPRPSPDERLAKQLEVEAKRNMRRCPGPDDVRSSPSLIAWRMPEQPPEARRRPKKGLVRADVFISADGRVDKVEIVESVPDGFFDEVVVDALGKWRYCPPGMPVVTEVEIPFKFQRDWRSPGE